MAAVFLTVEFAGKETEQHRVLSEAEHIRKVKRDCDREGTLERRIGHSCYERGNGQKLSGGDLPAEGGGRTTCEAGREEE